MLKREMPQTVHEATKERLAIVMRDFEHVFVMFSGGKDSGVLLNMAVQSAKEHGHSPVRAVYIDLEAQYQHTVDYVQRQMTRTDLVPVWLCLPLHLRNAVSQINPHWVCWDPALSDKWIRPRPTLPCVIHDPSAIPGFRHGMEFEDLTPLLGNFLFPGQASACLIGIRCDESLNRFRTLFNAKKTTYQGLPWSTVTQQHSINFYPLYDWATPDIWVANGKFQWDYNKAYSLMHQAGVPLSQMRLCQPYGDGQRKGLWLFSILEPETWARVVGRVDGANFGARHTKSNRQALGFRDFVLPEGHTYHSYARFLLRSMPPLSASHYRKKIAKFIRWWRKKDYRSIPDTADPKLESLKKVPSWRRICRVLIKNDYWCLGLSFAQTKRDFERQLALTQKNILCLTPSNPS